MPGDGVTVRLGPRYERYERAPDFLAEVMSIGLIEEAIGMMEQEGINKADLARAMEVKPAYVSRIFNAPPNMTLRTICQLAVALGTRPHVSLRPACAPEESELQKVSVLASRSGAASHTKIWNALGAQTVASLGLYSADSYPAGATLLKGTQA